MACNSSSVNVSISFHADKISSIIVLYGSPFPIHKLTKAMMTHELKPVGWTTYEQRSTDPIDPEPGGPWIPGIRLIFVNFPIDGSGGEFLFGFPLFI